MSKNVRIGSLVVNEYKGKRLLSIGLGNKSKNSKYDLHVEVVVKDSQGKVVSKQTDGFLGLEDPRTKPDELLAAGIISEDIAHKMKEDVSKLSDKVKYNLTMSVK